jgi:hypothetical protein
VVKGGGAGKRSARTLDDPGREPCASHNGDGRPIGRLDRPKSQPNRKTKLNRGMVPRLSFVADVPDGWRPPSQAATTLLSVVVAVHARQLATKDAA